ncbi:hypothetical protein HYC85_024826 [Camellia sinensis]|uniref:Protein kinase domain-containing protein n=1 Tax=Camellia sinensis TaxID=4442 RepID=A0A7J7G978_CAMSI|nr:hypothetical protein HYC85_024826 [Camellia sinensis]
MVKKITGGFTRMTCFEEDENFKTYCGFTGELECVLKAEKKAALSMHHKNILELSSYYKGKNDSKGKQQTKITFQEKIKMAIGISEGVRYMHEECPRGPVVHGDLRPCNIFLNFDLEPQITDFGNATWLHLKQRLPISSNRFWHTDPSDHESLALLKFDIIHFGILLLRLFCSRSAPWDDKIFVDCARPLLLQRAFHKLLDKDMEDVDIYEIFRIISVLKGETSCAMQLSPSLEGSPNMDFSGSSICRLVRNLTSELSLSK